MNKEHQEVLLAVQRKYKEATNAGDRVVVKWLGWLAVFLSMDKEERIKFVSNDLQIKLTKTRFTNDLYGIREQKIRTTTND